MTGSSNIHLARGIALRHFGPEAEVVPAGLYNPNIFRVTAADVVHYLKLAKSPDDTGLRKEAVLIAMLRGQGVPVAPVRDHGKSAEDGREFLVMDSAGDTTVGHALARGDTASLQLCAEMGATLARVHGLRLPAAGDIRADGIVPLRPDELLNRLHSTADWLVERGLLRPEEAAAFRRIPMPSIDGTELCHGDFHAVHCLVTEDRITAVVDWESAWSGNSAIDLAVTHAYLNYYCPLEGVRSFLAGYAQVKPLPPDYDRVYLPARMAHALGLAKVWRLRARPGEARRAVELFRIYAKHYARAGG